MGRYPYFDAQPGKQDLEALNNMMYETDIFHLKDRDYNTLSGGEKQRVHLSRVMAQQLRMKLPTNWFFWMNR